MEAEGEKNQCPISEALNIRDKSFSVENVRECQRLSQSPQECLRYLGEVLDLREYITKARHSFVVDYFHGINQFLSDAKFQLEQGFLVFNLGKDLLCTLIEGASYAESEKFFETQVLSLNANLQERGSEFVFSFVDIQKLIDFFVSTFFQHYNLYKYCFTKECYTISKKEVVRIETILVPPLAEALSKEEVEAQELAMKEASEAEERSRLEAAAKAEAERLAMEETMRVEESKKKPQSLDDAIEFIIREKLDDFKKSFLEGCLSEQKKVLEKLQQLETMVVPSGSAGETKTKKPR